ncbi:MAG: family 10 glycosylhydrolase [Cyanobacteria bacterium]|nr:family 10 glycosylhydrolase [Cyanobacteriota bacterium]
MKNCTLKRSIFNSKTFRCLCQASILMFGILNLEGEAQVKTEVILAEPRQNSADTSLTITGTDVNRGDDSLILYTHQFGKSTATNPYGVEVILEHVSTKELSIGHHSLPENHQEHYRVTQVTNIFECQKNKDLKCGDAIIPKNGIVLSATGSQRLQLLKALPLGQRVFLKQSWFQSQSFPLAIINPTALTNPLGSAFPGFRASHQLIIYDKNYGQTKTGTNEFGFEVTVENGRVTNIEGSNSTIPENGYVLSGHGRARNWLIANATLGAKIQMEETEGEGKNVIATLDATSYQYQLERRMNEAHQLLPENEYLSFRKQQEAIQATFKSGQDELGAKNCMALLENLNQNLWHHFPHFDAQSIRGVWLRPVEKSQKEIGQRLDILKASGLNTVFLETYFHGYTIFPSQTFEKYGLTAQNPKFTGTDLLSLWVSEAHKRNMKLHVWFQDFYAGTTAFNPPGPILSKYPEWANVQYVSLDKKGPTPSNLETGAYFLDPANPLVQNFLLSLADEIVSRYPIDGFQMDYIRYPASFPPDRFSYLKTTWGYTLEARKQFIEKEGIDPINLTPDNTEKWAAWGAFKSLQVSRFVEKMSHLIREKKPNILLSAAVFPKYNESLSIKHQNWPLWAENHWIDALAPMTLTSSIKIVEEDVQRVKDRTQDKTSVIAGLFSPFNQNTAETLLEQISASKQYGAKGYAIFDSAHLTGRMLNALKASQTR